MHGHRHTSSAIPPEPRFATCLRPGKVTNKGQRRPRECAQDTKASTNCAISGDTVRKRVSRDSEMPSTSSLKVRLTGSPEVATRLLFNGTGSLGFLTACQHGPGEQCQAAPHRDCCAEGNQQQQAKLRHRTTIQSIWHQRQAIHASHPKQWERVSEQMNVRQLSA